MIVCSDCCEPFKEGDVFTRRAGADEYTHVHCPGAESRVVRLYEAVRKMRETSPAGPMPPWKDANEYRRNFWRAVLAAYEASK